MAYRKLALGAVDSAALMLAALYVWHFVEYMFPDAPLLSRLGWLAAYGALLFVVLVGVSCYLNHLKRVLRGIAFSVAPLVMGVAIAQFLIIQNFESLDSGMMKQLAAALVLWFWIRGYAVAERISDRFPLPEHEVRKMVAVLPPRSFHDMWSFHLFFLALFVIMPFAVQQIWGQFS